MDCARHPQCARGSAAPLPQARVAHWRNAMLRPACCTLLACACTLANAQCASAPPVTGLGACIDAMAAHSDRVTRQVNDLGFRLYYGPASYTDHELKRIYIQAYDCRQGETAGLNARLSLLAHELGHAEYGVRQDTGSRAAYIRSWCDAEGYAVINNFHARAQTLQCTGNSVDIGLAAANPGDLMDLHRQGGNDVRRIGVAFCARNFTSTTRQNYLDYYGAFYDAHY